MGILSYAQNFEDILLFRALGHVGQGFYIDIGAQHPTVDSVSKAFHEAGWSGIHVEPVEVYAEMLERERRGDVVLRVGIGAKRERVRFFEFPDTGLSTAAEVVATAHATNGRVPVERDLDLWTLDNLLEEAGGRTVHWLKIDVEGYERQVLEGWQTCTARPWIVIIEATFPNTSEETADQWESYILGKGYSLAHADGLNRYYVHESQPSLAEALRFGPNVFDQFQLADCVWSTRHVVAQYNKTIDDLSAQLERARHAFQGREQEYKNDLAKSRAETEALQQWSAEKLREAQVRQNSTDAKISEIEGDLARSESERSDIAARLHAAEAESEGLRLRLLELHGLEAALERERRVSDALRDQISEQRVVVTQAAADVAASSNELGIVKEKLSAALAQGEAALMSAKAQWLQERLEIQSKSQSALDDCERQVVAARELLEVQRRDADLRLVELRESTRRQIVDKDAQLANVVAAAQAWQLETNRKEEEYSARLNDLQRESEKALDAQKRAHATQISDLYAQVRRLEADRAKWLQQERELRATILASTTEAGDLRLQVAKELSERERVTIERLSNDHFRAIQALSDEHEHRLLILQGERAQLLLANDRLLRQVEQTERDLAERVRELVHAQEVTDAEWNSRLRHAAEVQQAEVDTLQRQGEAIRLDLENRIAEATQRCTSLQSERDAFATRLVSLESNLAFVSERRHLIKSEIERLSLATGDAESTLRTTLAEWRTKTRWWLFVGANVAAISTQAKSLEEDFGVIRSGIEALSALGESLHTATSTHESPWRRPEVHDTRVAHVDELLLMSAPDLIERAYSTILGRRPDSVGRAHYMKRLALGDGNADVLFSIADSIEARSKQGVRLPGLEEFVQTQRRGRRGIGWLVRAISDGKRAANRTAFLIDQSTDQSTKKAADSNAGGSMSAIASPLCGTSEGTAASFGAVPNAQTIAVPASFVTEEAKMNVGGKPVQFAGIHGAAPLVKVRRAMMAVRKSTPLSPGSISRRAS